MILADSWNQFQYLVSKSNAVDFSMHQNIIGYKLELPLHAHVFIDITRITEVAQTKLKMGKLQKLILIKAMR